MGSTLEHGIYLPSEGEKNCYQGLAGNWQAVDTNIGYVTALRQAIAGALTRQIVTQLPTEDIDPNCIYMILKATAQTNNIYDEYMYINSSWELIGDSQLDLSNYYTKQEVNQLPAVASGVTATKVGNYDAHIANGDIHVTASDKAKWTNSANTHVLRLALSALTPSTSNNSFSNLDDSTALKVGDKVIDPNGVLYEVTAVDATNQLFTIGTAIDAFAKDSNVLHNTGNETASGFKTFNRYISIDGGYIGNEFSNNARTNFILRANRDTAGKSCAYISRFRQNKAQGSMSASDLHMFSFDVLENEVRTNNTMSIQCSGWQDDVPTKVKILSGISDSTFGSSARPSKINDLEPSALSMPDLANGIDISSYITTGNTDNNYTPPVNGWIWIRLLGNGAGIVQGDFGINANYVSDNLTDEKRVETNLFVTKNVQATIRCRSITGIVSAYFYPCQGNV